MCYLCHQRDKRNQFIDVSEEKRLRELQYEKLLKEYQDRECRLALAKDREAKKISELFAKEAKLYNFDIAQRKVCV